MPKWKGARTDIVWTEKILPRKFQPIIYESYLAAENYLVKPTEYKPCPGLYRHALRDLKLFDRVI